MNKIEGKLLILAWGVYPSTGGSTIILNNISEGFTNEELVIAGQVPPVIPEKKWESFSDIKLYYIDPFPLHQRRPEKYIRWLAIRKSRDQIVRIIEKENVTSILSIFPDEYYSYLGYHVSKKLKLPYFIWLHNSYLENRRGVLKILAQYLQPKLFQHAKKVFVMSDGLNEELAKNNPDVNFETLVHGFKLELPPIPSPPVKSNKTKFLYSGSINDSCLDASLRMLNVILEDKNHEVHIFSGNPQVFKEQDIEGDQIYFHDFLPLQDFVASLYKYDIMLLPHGIDGARSDFEYKTIFPTRTIPLLFSGKPILAHSPENSFLTKFLKENNCALTITEKSKEQLRSAIEELKDGGAHIDRMVYNAKHTSKQFELKRVINKLKVTIEG